MSAEPPLLACLREIIAAEGPIGVDRYMALALGHPAHGYYMTRDPFGAAGDFVTAPEISQMFGELAGLWCAAMWQGMGAPVPLRLVELGPGRGTLMADLLRAAASVPGFRAALDVHLVETSPALRARQAARLADCGCPVHWHAAEDSVPDGPVLVLANEFFDALPVRHYVRTSKGWCERLVGVGADGRLAFGLSAEPEPRLTAIAPPGTLIEIGAEAAAVAGRLAARLARSDGAALIIDYGGVGPAFGETLQAVRRHAFVDVLATPGEADLTAHVDFGALRRAAEAAGARAYGPVAQGAFLEELGIAARAERLAARNPGQVPAVAAALARLTDRGTEARPGMGLLFRALALTAPEGPTPPGFAGSNGPGVASSREPAGSGMRGDTPSPRFR